MEQEKALGWNEAEEICVCCKAHLASVTSIQIQDMLAAKVAKWSRSIWIGASDQGSEGHWVWADGSPIGFSHWYVGWVGENDVGTLLPNNMLSNKQLYF